MEASKSFLYQWVIDLSSIASLVGLVITIFLWFEARKIRRSFAARARIPAILKDLKREVAGLSGALKDWDANNEDLQRVFHIIHNTLESLLDKLPNTQKQKVISYLRGTVVRRYLVIPVRHPKISKDEAWLYYVQLSGVVAGLDQYSKDLHWD